MLQISQFLNRQITDLSIKLQDFCLDEDLPNKISEGGLLNLKNELKRFIAENYLEDYRYFRKGANIWHQMSNVVNNVDPNLVYDLLFLHTMEELIYQVEHFESDLSYGIDGVAMRSITMATYVASIIDSMPAGFKENNPINTLLNNYLIVLLYYIKDNEDLIKTCVSRIYTDEEYFYLEGGYENRAIVDLEESRRAFWLIINSSFNYTVSGKNTELLMKDGLLGFYSMSFKVDDSHIAFINSDIALVE